MSDPEDPNRYGEPAKPWPSCGDCESTGWFGVCPHTGVDEPKLEEQSDAAFVRDLLWSDHLECCGMPTATNHGVHGWEEHCCGRPEPALLNDAQIVATLRARFPNA